MQRGGDSLTFLEAIFEPAMARTNGYLLLWTDSPKKSAWFRSIEQAADYASRCNGNTYVGVGLSGQDYGTGQRAKSSQIISVPAFWLDIDVKSPVHKHDDLPPDLDSAWSIVRAVGSDPTVVVETGHGLQAWWRITDGDCPTDERRAHVATIVRNWQQTQMKKARDSHGWRIDATHDLARIMRIPGTWNMKAEPVPVTISFFAAEALQRRERAETECDDV